MRNPNRLSIIVLIIFLVYNIYRYIKEIISPTPMSKESILLSISFAVATFLIYLFRTEKQTILKGNYVSIVVIISLSMIIVHYFEYLSWITGAVKYIRYIEYYDNRLLNASVIASVSGYISFTIGALLPKYPFTDFSENLPKCNIKSILNKLQFISLVVFVAFIDKNYFKGGYNEVSNTTGMNVIAAIAQQVIMAAMLANVASKALTIKAVNFIQYIKQYSILFYFVNIVYFFLVISSGDRGPMIYMSMMYVAGYFICSYKKLSLKKALIGLIFASFFLNVLGSVRSLGQGEFSIDKVVQGYKIYQERIDDENEFAATNELSTSVMSYNIIYCYTYNTGILGGIGMLNHLLGIIPGARYILYNYILGIDIKSVDIIPGRVATKLLDRENGAGTTCFADVYFDLGFIGLIVIFLLFGVLMRKLDLSLYNNHQNPIVMIFAIGYFSFSIYIGRADIFSPIIICSYALLLYFFCQMRRDKFFIQKNKKS